MARLVTDDGDMNPDVPCYKGSVVAGAVTELNKRLDCGEITRDEAERFLQPEDFDMLEGVVMASQFYPLAAYARMCELLFQTIGRGSKDYLDEQGRESARSLIDGMGLYTQLNHVDHVEAAKHEDPQERFEAFGRDLELMNMVNGSIGNFGHISSRRDPDHPLRWIAEQELPVEFTDTLVWRVQGFRNEMAKRHGHDHLWTWERKSPTLIAWRMTRDL